MGFRRFLRHAAQDAEGIVDPRNYYKAGKFLATDPVGFGEGVVHSYASLVRHPIRSFESNPISSVLAVTPAVGALGAAAKIARVGEMGSVATLAKEMRAAGYSPQDAARAAQREAVKVRSHPSSSVMNDPRVVNPPRTSQSLDPNPESYGHAQNIMEILKRGGTIGGGAQRKHPITGRDHPAEVVPGARGQGTTGPAQYMTNSPQWQFLDGRQTNPGYNSNGMTNPGDAVSDTIAMKKIGGDNGRTGGLLSINNRTAEYQMPNGADSPGNPRMLLPRDYTEAIRDKTFGNSGVTRVIQQWINHDSNAGAYPDIGFRINPKGGPMAKGKGGNPLASPDMQSHLRNAQSNLNLEMDMDAMQRQAGIKKPSYDINGNPIPRKDLGSILRESGAKRNAEGNWTHPDLPGEFTGEGLYAALNDPNRAKQIRDMQDAFSKKVPDPNDPGSMANGALHGRILDQIQKGMLTDKEATQIIRQLERDGELTGNEASHLDAAVAKHLAGNKPPPGAYHRMKMDQARADVNAHANDLLRGDDGAGAEYSKKVDAHPLGPHFRDYKLDYDAPESVNYPGGRQFGSTINKLPNIFNKLTMGYPQEGGPIKGSAAWLRANSYDPDRHYTSYRGMKKSDEQLKREILKDAIHNRTNKGHARRLGDQTQRELMMQILNRMYPGGKGFNN